MSLSFVFVFVFYSFFTGYVPFPKPRALVLPLVHFVQSKPTLVLIQLTAISSSIPQKEPRPDAQTSC